MKTRYLLLTSNDESNIGVIKLETTVPLNVTKASDDIQEKVMKPIQDHFDIDEKYVKIKSTQLFFSIPMKARVEVELDGEKVIIELNETYVY